MAQNWLLLTIPFRISFLLATSRFLYGTQVTLSSGGCDRLRLSACCELRRAQAQAVLRRILLLDDDSKRLPRDILGVHKSQYERVHIGETCSLYYQRLHEQFGSIPFVEENVENRLSHHHTRRQPPI
jgi:hypothetical protein